LSPPSTEAPIVSSGINGMAISKRSRYSYTGDSQA
jgi:hypothetical protein